MRIASANLQVVHNTFSVFDPHVVSVSGNFITDETIRQGSSWRIGNVDFSTVRGGGYGSFEDYDEFGLELQVLLDQNILLSADAVRAIQVPFTVVGTGGVGIFDGVGLVDVLGVVPAGVVRNGNTGSYLPIPANSYALIFEQGWKCNPQARTANLTIDKEASRYLYSLWGRLWFKPEVNAEAKILLRDARDSELNPTYPLRMDAKPLF